MKRMICLMLILLILTGCGNREAEAETSARPVTFYYCGIPGEYSSSAVIPETRGLEDWDISLREFMNLYLEGPTSEGMRSPFPEGTAVEELRLVDRVIYVTFNDAYSSLTGVALTMANACLVYTLTQFTDVDGVCIQTTGSMLTEQLSVILTREDFLVEDDTELGDLKTVKLYFMDESRRWLRQETRMVSLDTDRELILYLMQQLLPESSDGQLALPEGTKLLDIRVSDMLCTVDFSEEFLTNRPEDSIEARLTVMTVVNTLTELQQIERVRILCDGKAITEGYYMNLNTSLVRDETVLENQSIGDCYDADLYVTMQGSELLVPIPYQVTQVPARMLATQVMNALVELELVNGYENPIPKGAYVLDLTVKDGLCTVYFNSAFALCDADALQARQAVRAVVMTLCALDGVNSVKIDIRNAELTQIDLSEPLTADTAWVIS